MIDYSEKKARILLIDDDASLMRLLKQVTERAFGDRALVESCTDPINARRRINEGDVDILVTDLEMPAISGLDLLRTAKRRNAFTQVILVTGHSSHQALLDALEFGATDYLLKPIDHDGLIQLIQEALLRRRRWQVALSESARQLQQTTASPWS